MKKSIAEQMQYQLKKYDYKYKASLFLPNGVFHIFTLFLSKDLWNVREDKTIFCTFQTHYRSGDALEKLYSVEYLMTNINANEGLERMEEELLLSDFKRWNQTRPFQDMTPIRVSESVYNHMLECLPPRNWVKGYFEVGEPDHHDSNGRAIHRAFFKIDGKFYTGYPVKGRPTARTKAHYKNLLNLAA